MFNISFLASTKVFIGPDSYNCIFDSLESLCVCVRVYVFLHDNSK